MVHSVAERIRPYLDADERILWAAKPDLRQSMGYELCRIGGFLALLAGFAFASILFVLTTSGYAALFEIPLVRGAMICALGLFFTSLPLVWGLWWLLFRWSTAQFVYAITNHSFLWMHPRLWPLPGKKLLVRRFSLKEAYDLQIVLHRNGFGTLIFLGVWLPTLHRRNGFPHHPAFRAIPDVDRVVAIARTAAQQSGFVEQPKPLLHWQILKILREEIWLYTIASILATIFSFTFVINVFSSKPPPDFQFVNVQHLIVGVLMCLTLGGLMWSFRVRETLRRYPRLRHWQIILVFSQAGLLSIWLGMMYWIRLM